MQIDISLPDCGLEQGEAAVSHWLKQLELAVHHAQKSLKEMAAMIRERDGDESSLTGYLRVKHFMSNDEDSNEGMGKVEIRIYEG